MFIGALPCLTFDSRRLPLLPVHLVKHLSVIFCTSSCMAWAAISERNWGWGWGVCGGGWVGEGWVCVDGGRVVCVCGVGGRGINESVGECMHAWMNEWVGG